MDLTAKPLRGDMGGHANQYFTSSATAWWSMGTEGRDAANTVIDSDGERSGGGPARVSLSHLDPELGVVGVIKSQEASGSVPV